MGALYDDWCENAPNGVSWEDWTSGNYNKPDYWERKRKFGYYKSKEEEIEEKENEIRKLREQIKEGYYVQFGPKR